MIDRYERAMACVAGGQRSEAFAILRGLVEQDPGHHQAYVALANLFVEEENISQALECVRLAIEACPTSSVYKQKFVHLVQHMRVRRANPAMKEMLLDCLADPRVNCAPLAAVWHSAIAHDPRLRPLIAGRRGRLAPALLDPCFLAGLERLLVCDAAFEGGLTNLRRTLLRALLRKGGESRHAGFAPLVKALACYCHRSQYVFFSTAEEERTVATLRRGLEKRGLDESSTTRLLLLACYQPLHLLKNAPALLERALESDAPPLVLDLLRLQVNPWLRQQEIRKSMALEGGIRDHMSRKVRAQYEGFPYPQWESASRTIKDEVAEGWLRGRKANILVAGCGTGIEPIELAAVFTEADVLAVDLSLSSLSYARMKADDYGLRNVRFAQGDLLTLDSLGRQFDYIACSGVLNCLREPVEGWRVLTRLLRPGGTMRIALYSRRARAAITRARAVIAQRHYGTDAPGIRWFRKNIGRALKARDVRDISNFRDYFYLSGCCDLLFAAQEQVFDLREIGQALESLDLEFVKFSLPDAVMRRYVRDNPGDPEARNLDLWARFEDENPHTFRSMYRFWCRPARPATSTM